jgi:hypothetical protein
VWVCAICNKDSFTEEVTFEQRLGGNKRINLWNSGKRAIKEKGL